MLILEDFANMGITRIALTKEMKELYSGNFWILTKETIEYTDIEFPYSYTDRNITDHQ